jgi:hypothetical protein
LNFTGKDCGASVKPLKLIAAEFAKLLELLHRVHTLGDNLEPQTVSEGDYRFDDG